MKKLIYATLAIMALLTFTGCPDSLDTEKYVCSYTILRGNTIEGRNYAAPKFNSEITSLVTSPKYTNDVRLQDELVAEIDAVVAKYNNKDVKGNLTLDCTNNGKTYEVKSWTLQFKQEE